jgi:protocatechuate 3,4-dioxygenase beta subunit
MRFWILSLVVLVLLAGCAQAPAPTEVAPTEQVFLPQVEVDEPANPTPAEASQPELEATVADEGAGALEPTPIPCSGNLTSPNQEGPYYSAGSPQRASLIEEGMPGTPVLIIGRVFDQDCNPIAGARLDFWLADVNGEYDNQGYTLRGHVFSDQNGYYQIESIEPGKYTGRPPHIHVKVFAADGRELLTSQMYFPGSEGSPDVNAAPDLLVEYLSPDESGRKRVLFTFIVRN